MNNQRACLYDVPWQRIRVSMLTQYNTTGGWVTIDGAVQNIQTLRQYSLAKIREKPALLQRLWRILNMYNAVRMGYSGTNLKGSVQDQKVKTERDHIKKMYHDLKAYIDFPAWDWKAVIVDLRQLKKGYPEEFRQIQNNLTVRLKTAKKRKGNQTDREELEYFLKLMKETN